MPDYVSRRDVLLGMSVGLTGCLGESGVFGVEEVSEKWPLYRFDKGNTGYSMEVSCPEDDVDILWEGGVTDYLESSPVVSGGRLYWCGREDLERRSKVRCVDAVDNEEVWSYVTGVDELATSPAVGDGVVYLGDRGGTAYAVDEGSGGLVWSTEVSSRPLPSPKQVGDYVFFGSNMLDAGTGEVVRQHESVESTVAVGDDFFYVIRDGVLRAFDGDGDVVWRYEQEAPSEIEPVFYDGRVLLGGGSAVSLDGGSGDVIWELLDGDSWVNTPAVGDGRIYLISRDIDDMSGSVVCVDMEDGERVWRRDSIAYTSQPPVVVDGVLLYVNSAQDGSILDGVRGVFSSGSTVNALDAGSGSRLWGFDTGTRMRGNPVVAGGVVFVSTHRNHIYALAESG